MSLSLSNKIGNVMGVPLPTDLRRQLQIRSAKNLSIKGDVTEGLYYFDRSTENIQYLENKTGFVRLISSVDIQEPSLSTYNRKLPDGIKFSNPSDPAKQFVLSAGTSIYKNDNGSFRYDFRAGLSEDGLGAYGNIGSKNEIRDYGYRPMPGIIDAKIQTQGRLGSVRQATINFKVWTKDQLDIIDALYFKMGYMMFLEWGHGFYYDNKGKLMQMGITIDPFEPGLTKEKLNILISRKKEETFGNYDAMLGMCTQFNFDFNQEGGYDCSIKMIGLGALAESAKVNVATNIPDISKEQIEQLFNFYRKYIEDKERAEAAAEAARNPAPAPAAAAANTSAGRKTSQEYITANKSDVTAANVADWAIPASNQSEADKATKGSVVLVGGAEDAIVNRDSNIILPIKPDDDPYDRFTLNHNVLKQYYASLKKVVQAPANQRFGKINKNGYYGYSTPWGTLSIRWKDFGNSGNSGDTTTVYFDIYSAIQSTTNNRYYPVGMSFSIKASNNAGNLMYISDPISDNTVVCRAIQGARYKSGEVQFAEEIQNDDALWFEVFLASLLEHAEGPSWTNAQYGLSVAISKTTDDKKYIFTNGSDFSSMIPLRNRLQPTEGKSIYSHEIDKTTVNSKGFTYKQGILLSHPIKMYAPKLDAISSTSAVTTNAFEWRDEKISVYYNFGPDSSLVTGATLADPENQQFLLQGFTATQSAAALQEQAQAAAAEQQAAAQAAADAAAEKARKDAEFRETVNQAVSEEKLRYSSGIETFLRTIELSALNSSISAGGFDFRSVAELDLTANLAGKPLINQLLSSGVFKDVDFINGIDEIKQKGLDIDSNKRDRLLSFAAYGFNHNMMAASDPKEFVIKNNLKTCDFKGMFKSWVMPYDVNTEVLKGMDTSHPVYIRFDLLLLALNSMCLLYDSPKSSNDEKPPEAKDQTPIIYIDFNTYTNTCLTSPLHMSIDIMKFLIQFRATNQQYALLFDRESIDESAIPDLVNKLRDANKNITDKEIEAEVEKVVKQTVVSNISAEVEKEGGLFKPESEDVISRSLPDFKDPNNTSTGAWQGRIMNVLVNVEYLLSLCKTFSNNDDSNGVYLKPFLDQILADMNKSMGDINLFRLSYDDRSNCLVIVDDQSSPLQENEKYPTSYFGAPENLPDVDFNPNSYELPLYGRRSIAKSLSIKTEVSTKLSNMLAISANSNKKSDVGKDASPFGQYNKDFVNRYMNQARIIDPGTQIKEGEKKAAIAFNEFVKSMFKTDTPQIDNIDSAKNYYIERMNDKKSERSATRASAMIPVSINFSTDGISGMSMGHAFTIPEQLLPVTYERFQEATGKRVGFIVVGLDHSIANNVWDTSIRANMFFMKKAEDYYTSDKYFNRNALAEGSVAGAPDITSYGGGGVGAAAGLVGDPVPQPAKSLAAVIQQVKSAATDEEAMAIWAKYTEGSIAYAMWDISNWRIGYGSGTITIAESGLVVKLPGDKTKQPTALNRQTGQLTLTDIGDTVSRDAKKMKNGDFWKPKMSNMQPINLITVEDMDADMKRRIIQDFIPKAKKNLAQNGVDWNTLSREMKVAAFKAAYGYGHVPNWFARTYASSGQSGLASYLASLGAQTDAGKASHYGATKAAQLLSS